MVQKKGAEKPKEKKVDTGGIASFHITQTEQEELGLALDARITIVTGMHTKLMKERQMDASRLVHERIKVLVKLKERILA